MNGIKADDRARVDGFGCEGDEWYTAQAYVVQAHVFGLGARELFDSPVFAHVRLNLFIVHAYVF